MEEKKLQEEIFCLNLELKAMSEILLKGEAERLVPNFTQPRMEHDHMIRYELASQYTQGKDVIDIACGTGYGAYYLATEGCAKSIIGGDINKDSIRYAKHRYEHEKIDFQIQDAQNISLNHKVDVITSFETIEHVPDYTQMLHSINNLLKDFGIFIVSTPISAVDIDTNPANPYHLVEWGFEKFQSVIADFFVIDKVYVQLFQNAFLNETIWTDYINRRSKLNFFQRIQSRLTKISTGTRDLPQLHLDWNNKSNFSKLEEYKGQYSSCSLGTKYIGYQILICRKKEDTK